MKFLSALLIAISSPLAMAGTTICTDSGSNLRYELWQQEGGACCGRSTLEISIRGLTIKHREVINGHMGNQDQVTDDNPELVVEENDYVDMNNTVVYQDTKQTNFAQNLILKRTDGKPVVEDGPKELKVSVICTATSSTRPLPSAPPRK